MLRSDQDLYPNEQSYSISDRLKRHPFARGVVAGAVGLAAIVVVGPLLAERFGSEYDQGVPTAFKAEAARDGRIANSKPKPKVAIAARESGALVCSINTTTENGLTLWAIARRVQPTGDVRPLVDQLAHDNPGDVESLIAGTVIDLPSKYCESGDGPAAFRPKQPQKLSE